jgi:hypothetical protein
MNKKTFFTILIGLVTCFLMVNCQKSNPKEVQSWDPNWLIGTWEGTTPSSITPFENTKIKIVFREVQLRGGDSLPYGSQKIWAYDGTFTWDVDGDAWSMDFSSSNYPQPDENIIIWDCLTMTQANTTVNNISLRIADLVQTDPLHGVDLDWGPVNNTTGSAPTQLDFYGDVTIDIGDQNYRAEYPPQSGSWIRLKKK